MKKDNTRELIFKHLNDIQDLLADYADDLRKDMIDDFDEDGAYEGMGAMYASFASLDTVVNFLSNAGVMPPSQQKEFLKWTSEKGTMLQEVYHDQLNKLIKEVSEPIRQDELERALEETVYDVVRKSLEEADKDDLLDMTDEEVSACIERIAREQAEIIKNLK